MSTSIVHISHANALNHSHAIQLLILKHELTVKLIHSLCFGTESVNWKATWPNSFLCVVVLMSDLYLLLVGFPFQPLNRHFTAPLFFEVVDFQSSCILLRRHIQHDCSKVQCVCIITDHFLARFRFYVLSYHFCVAYKSLVFLMVSIKYNTWTANVIVFHCVVQVFVFLRK